MLCDAAHIHYVVHSLASVPAPLVSMLLLLLLLLLLLRLLVPLMRVACAVGVIVINSSYFGQQQRLHWNFPCAASIYTHSAAKLSTYIHDTYIRTVKQRYVTETR